ncbi:MAG: DHH family phosphoesterase, partial [Patescibacteria group bacterium]
MQKRWKIKNEESKVVTSESRKSLADIFFANRGITSQEDINGFLSPNWDHGIHDPFFFRQMPQAVERVFRAIENGERITIHGDYDADGVCGSAVLMTTLTEIIQCFRNSSPNPILLIQEEGENGVWLDSYIPHRDKEGYGLNTKSVQYLHERGTNLIITVDCGIANVEEIALAKSLGIDTIIVDHHQFGDEHPDGILIHPKLPGETYPFPHLAAVGVAWKLACALCIEARIRGIEIPVGWEKWLLDFVSIATVTDMVPIVGENRVLETFGLKVINKTRRPGLRALIDIAGYELGKIDTEAIGFGLGPRINAAGRMDHASLALRLLLAENDEEAIRLARELESKNRARQQAAAKMMGEAEMQIVGAQCIAPEQKGVMNHAPTQRLIALWSDQWSPSLVGLIAGRYLDKTGKPTIAIGKHGEKWIGSGRSFAEYDITAAVKVAGEGILSRAGGHVQACGF